MAEETRAVCFSMINAMRMTFLLMIQYWASPSPFQHLRGGHVCDPFQLVGPEMNTVLKEGTISSPNKKKSMQLFKSIR